MRIREESRETGLTEAQPATAANWRCKFGGVELSRLLGRSLSSVVPVSLPDVFGRIGSPETRAESLG